MIASSAPHNQQSAEISAQEKLWKLASNPFSVIGEARVAGSEIAFSWLGDTPPETKLGLAAGTFPKTVEAVLAMMHADDGPKYRQGVLHSLNTGEAVDLTYRLADGQGGWRWIEGRAVPTVLRHTSNWPVSPTIRSTLTFRNL